MKYTEWGTGLSTFDGQMMSRHPINRQLSGRNPPPLVTRAFGAHQNEAKFINHQKANWV